jgi:SAM-dependent methyltransferase
MCPSSSPIPDLLRENASQEGVLGRFGANLRGPGVAADPAEQSCLGGVRAHDNRVMGGGDLSAAWDAKADEWTAWARTPGHDEFFHRLNWPAFARLLPDPGSRTLDLGCGEGRIGRKLARWGHRLTGVDSSPALVQLAREGGGYEDVVCTGAEQLPFPAAHFELAVAFMSLITMDDPAAAIHETARVLVPGGEFCLAILHPLNRPEELIADYFRDHRVAVPIERDGIRMVFEDVHRPLEAYTAPLADAGFTIKRLAEPTAPSGTVAGVRGDASLHPYFMHLRCRLDR